MPESHPHVHCKTCSEPVVMPTCNCHSCTKIRDDAKDRTAIVRVAVTITFLALCVMMSSLGGCWIVNHFEHQKVEQLLRTGQVEVIQDKDRNGIPFGEPRIIPKLPAPPEKK